ncbi:hypothetical protein ACFO1B_46820 [Dactylosporangium siamense]|uniref:Lipoprotein n=1 Tax=Dactylosporangium siamense TaxID=685454 RepID=A0A919PX39_9ACTN|nr:hypothetical protein [Dactylosporangium siamense]GIG51734.1 hypothetical protein Dsi01nite_097750 [Dactylosporangium siamense]
MALRSFLVLAVVATALGGCAASSDESAGAPSVAPASPSLQATPAPSRPAAAPSGTSISGEVVEGVEAGCLLLQTPGTLYLLIGGDRAALQVGKRITVVGTPQPGLMSTCQQGTPFQVVSVRSG